MPTVIDEGATRTERASTAMASAGGFSNSVVTTEHTCANRASASGSS